MQQLWTQVDGGTKAMGAGFNRRGGRCVEVCEYFLVKQKEFNGKLQLDNWLYYEKLKLTDFRNSPFVVYNYLINQRTTQMENKSYSNENTNSK